MNKITQLLAISTLSLLPLSALAADAQSSNNNANSAPAGELHGFDKYWSMIDKSGKGYITKDEWMAHATDHFKEIDTNSDGKITKDEMKAYDEKMYEKRREARAQYQKKNQGNN